MSKRLNRRAMARPRSESSPVHRFLAASGASSAGRLPDPDWCLAYLFYIAGYRDGRSLDQ